MNYKAFENLELIPKLLEKILILEEKIIRLEDNLIKPLNLTKRNDVKKYLEISDSTLNNMFKDGRLQIGKHYIKEIKIKNLG